MEKSLDRKLARILADPSCRDFIIADAKDADMAFGLAAPGRSPEHHAGEARFRTLDEYRQLMREIVAPGLVDIMLMSASSNEVLTIQERLFDDSHVTPAVRANDTTDIWLAAGTGRYSSQPSLPFRTATIDHIKCGKLECEPQRAAAGGRTWASTRSRSTTTSSWTARTLEGYKAFRLEAEAKGFRHFLEVFDPNACGEHPPKDVGRFINDHIVRALAGVTGRGRPLFLKIAYHGPAAMEALAALRPLAGGGHSRRLGRHHLRRLPHALGGEEVRRPRGPLRPEDQQRRAPVDVRHATCARWPTTRSRRTKRSAPTTPTSGGWASGRSARWKKTCSGPTRRRATAARARRGPAGRPASTRHRASLAIRRVSPTSAR